MAKWAMEPSIPSQYLLVLVALAVERGCAPAELFHNTSLNLNERSSPASRIHEAEAEQVISSALACSYLGLGYFSLSDPIGGLRIKESPEAEKASASGTRAPPSRAPSIRPESPAMATTHSVNSLVETNTQRSDSASELAPAQPPGFLGPRVVRKRDRWSDGERDSMAPPAKRPKDLSGVAFGYESSQLGLQHASDEERTLVVLLGNDASCGTETLLKILAPYNIETTRHLRDAPARGRRAGRVARARRRRVRAAPARPQPSSAPCAPFVAWRASPRARAGRENGL